MGDPGWLKEEKLSQAEVWEQRCREQITRAQNAEKELENAFTRIRHLESGCPWAGGSSPEEATRAFCEMAWPGEEVADIDQRGDLQVTEDTEPLRRALPYTPEGVGVPSWRWAVRCKVDGTSMKVGGYRLPGGAFVVTWWS